MKSKTTNLRTEVRDIGCALHAALCRERCDAGMPVVGAPPCVVFPVPLCDRADVWVVQRRLEGSKTRPASGLQANPEPRWVGVGRRGSVEGIVRSVVRDS